MACKPTYGFYMFLIGKKYKFGLLEFRDIVFNSLKTVSVCPEALEDLRKTRDFIDFLLANDIEVYGVTTGLADLRNQKVNSREAARFSSNLIESHDAGIGAPIPQEVTLGAMIARASSLAKGYSGFQGKSLQTLVQMINHRIIPQIPKTGSLGASGDLAFLARMARAMRGDDVAVWYKNETMSAGKALEIASIESFDPLAKEGLAVTNGTSFIISMLSIAYLRELNELENILALQGLFLNAIRSTGAAFNKSIHLIRNHPGQVLVADILSKHFEFSDFSDSAKVQDDYCIRCIPQIFGPKIEIILEQFKKIETELNAVTDNPLFFKGDEISSDVDPSRIWSVNNELWTVLSGGNFHGECLTTIADTICASNAKIAYTLERQISYMLNPYRNRNQLPIYLIPNAAKLGLQSGYMIAQYTANALVQRIAQLGVPTTIFNITSGNEAEDVVSYGATAAERLLEQLQYLRELNAIYLTVAVQAYSITRKEHLFPGKAISPKLLAEQIFEKIQDITEEEYPTSKEENFERRYTQALKILDTGLLQSILGNPLYSRITSKECSFGYR
ncbi:MAG: aromatic amino acid ammonia-lyase [Parachlamydiales bacterium]